MADTVDGVSGTGADGRVRTAFVLSGGGSLATVQVGMLRALAVRGFQPDLFIGSSAGALNAAFVAGRGWGAEPLAELAAAWRSLAWEDVSPFGWRHRRANLTGSRPSLASPNGLARLMSRHITYDRLEETSVPIHLVVTDVLSGRETLVSSGAAAAALVASAAAPSVLIDAHLRHAVALGASRVFVLPAGVACALATPPRSTLAKAVHSCTRRAAQRLVDEAAALAHAVELIVLPPVCPLAVPSTDFHHADELVAEAERVTLRWLDEGGHRRPSPPFSALHIHPAAGDTADPHRGRAA